MTRIKTKKLRIVNVKKFIVSIDIGKNIHYGYIRDLNHINTYLENDKTVSHITTSLQQDA